jgi:hypothetical protein
MMGNIYGQRDYLIKKIIPEEQQRSCGLHKLNDSEIANLDELFMTILSMNNLGDSAIEYLKNEGWSEVKVLGMRRIQLNEDSYPQDYLIAEKGSLTYLLEPRSYSRLSAGKYLGKMGYISCEIIDKNGTVVRFRTAETR